MNVDLVVVRLPYRPRHGSIRTGSVLVQDGDRYQVRWEDNGSEEEVFLGDYESAVPRDSLRFLSLTDPDGLRAVFAADPIPVFLRALAEITGPVPVKAIKAYLVDLGIEPADLKGSWSKARTTLLAHDQVIKDGTGAAMSFTWAGDDLPALPARPEPAPSEADADAPAQ